MQQSPQVTSTTREFHLLKPSAGFASGKQLNHSPLIVLGVADSDVLHQGNS